MKPFVIGIFCGESKPNTLEMFLEDFIADLSFLFIMELVMKVLLLLLKFIVLFVMRLQKHT